MKCPYCGEEMQLGCIQCRDGVYWSEKERVIAALNIGGGKSIKLNEKSIGGPFGGASAEAWLCEKCKKIVIEYYSKKFREAHEEEILLHQAAKNAFDEMGVKKLPKVKELQTEYAKLLEEKKKTYSEYRRSREEMRELLTAKANVDRVLKMEVEQDVEKEKDHGQR